MQAVSLMTEEIKKNTQNDSKLQIPFGATLKTLTMILRGMFIAEADKNFVTKEIIRKNTGLKAVEGNLPFLVYLKAIEKDQKDPKLFRLTEIGTRFAKSANANDNVETSKEMKNLLEVAYPQIINFVKLRNSSGNLDFDTVFNYIKTEARLKEDPKNPRGINPAYAVGVFALIDMLILAGYLDDSIKPKEIAPQPRKAEAQPSKRSKQNSNSEQIDKSSESTLQIAGMHPIAWGDSIRIYLKKGNKAEREKIAKLAKQFIDIYVDDSEENIG